MRLYEYSIEIKYDIGLYNYLALTKSYFKNNLKSTSLTKIRITFLNTLKLEFLLAVLLFTKN